MTRKNRKREEEAARHTPMNEDIRHAAKKTYGLLERQTEKQDARMGVEGSVEKKGPRRDRQGHTADEAALGEPGSPGCTTGRGPAGTGRGFRRTVHHGGYGVHGSGGEQGRPYLPPELRKLQGARRHVPPWPRKNPFATPPCPTRCFHRPASWGCFTRSMGNRLNRGLYHSGLLYSPDVLFFRDRKGRRFDVITCAAPNKKAAQQHQYVTDQEAEQAMRHRIAAWKEKTGVLVPGAFGCWVFGNDLGFVSAQSKELLGGKFRDCFRRAVFAVPDKKSFLVKYSPALDGVLVLLLV